MQLCMLNMAKTCHFIVVSVADIPYTIQYSIQYTHYTAISRMSYVVVKWLNLVATCWKVSNKTYKVFLHF